VGGLILCIGGLEGRLSIIWHILKDLDSYSIIDLNGKLHILHRYNRDLKLLRLGHNASINIFKVESIDECYSLTLDFKLALSIGDLEFKALHEALNRSYIRRSVDIQSIIDSIAEYGETAAGRVRMLLSFLSTFRMGITGRALSRENMPNTCFKLIDLSLLPSISHKILVTLTLMRRLRETVVIDDVSLLEPILVNPYFKSEFRSRVYERKAVLSSSSIKAVKHMIEDFEEVLISTINSETLRFLDELKLDVEERIDCGDDVSVVNVKFGDGGLNSVNLKKIPRIAAERFNVEDVIGPLPKEDVEEIPTAISRIFGGKAEDAAAVLEALSNGALTRDSLVTFIMHDRGLRSDEAVKLIERLSAYNLIRDEVGRDYRYYYRITSLGFKILDEYRSNQPRELGRG
jgi:predicted transcriptional regulator